MVESLSVEPLRLIVRTEPSLLLPTRARPFAPGEGRGTAAEPALLAASPSAAASDILRANRRTAYLASTWVLVFLLWHVVWYATDLASLKHPIVTGAARVVAYVARVLIFVLVVVGSVLPLSSIGR